MAGCSYSPVGTTLTSKRDESVGHSFADQKQRNIQPVNTVLLNVTLICVDNAVVVWHGRRVIIVRIFFNY